MALNNRKLARCVPSGFVLRVHHIHDSETLGLFAHGKRPKYVTQAYIYRDFRDKEHKLITDMVVNPPLVMGESRCSHKDNPSRKVGYHTAVTRALRELSAVRRGAAA